MNDDMLPGVEPMNIGRWMLRFSLSMLVLAGLVGSAEAINWAGHDDWLADQPAALDYERSLGRAVRPPAAAPRAKGCQPRSAVGSIPANPYEPVLPLCPDGRPRH